MPKATDDFFFTLSAIAMFVFIVEILASMYAIEGYFPSFFFWLDLVSTVTMIPDIGWLWLAIIGGDNSGGDN